MELEIKKLIKKYKNGFTLDINRLLLKENSIVGLVGHNGAGKTTLLKCLLDLVSVDKGAIFYDGQEIQNSNSSWKLKISSFLDKSFLIDFVTIKEYLVFVGSLYGIKKEEITSYLDVYTPFLFKDQKYNDKKYIRDLSSGNQQKVGLTASLFVKPKILILDEPHTHLDPSGQNLLMEYLVQLKKSSNTLILLSSHNLNFVSDICDRIILIDNGKIKLEVQQSDFSNSEQLNKYIKLKFIDLSKNNC
ncbi:MAG: ABC transporter ATP-binding protein [Arcobacter sp.]|nr:ABC transporter ATP-binding protein [Arcobacter sp.]